MSDKRVVEQGIRNAQDACATGRIVANTAPMLMNRLGVRGMSKPQFQQALATLKHQRVIRGFCLKTGNVYIQT